MYWVANTSRPSSLPYGNMLTCIVAYFKVPLNLEDCVTQPLLIISTNSLKTLRFYKTATWSWKHVWAPTDEATALGVHLLENSSLVTLAEGLERLRKDHVELRAIIQTEMGLFSMKLDDLICMTSLVNHGVKIAVNFKPSDLDHVASVPIDLF